MMKILSALLTLSVATSFMASAQFTCQTPMYCPCGNTGERIEVCLDTESKDPCGKWLRCKSCQNGLDKCLKCEHGFEGPLCDIPNKQEVENNGEQPILALSEKRPTVRKILRRVTANCGRTFVQNISRSMLMGNKSPAGEWPWLVAISVQENNFTQLICAGALVDSRTVLTAAHCLNAASRFTLSFGKVFRQNKNDDAGVQVRQSTRIVIHPDFSYSTSDSDIGLLMFEPRIRLTSRVQPICLPTAESTARNLNTGKLGYVAGWGLTERQLPAEILRVSRLPVVSNQVCIQSYKNHDQDLSLTRNMFCAGSKQGQRVPCIGDGGAPLVFYDSLSEKFTVEGLVSFGARGQCGVPEKYAVFTKVYRYIPWILRNLR